MVKRNCIFYWNPKFEGRQNFTEGILIIAVIHAACAAIFWPTEVVLKDRRCITWSALTRLTTLLSFMALICHNTVMTFVIWEFQPSLMRQPSKHDRIEHVKFVIRSGKLKLASAFHDPLSSFFEVTPARHDPYYRTCQVQASWHDIWRWVTLPTTATVRRAAMRDAILIIVARWIIIWRLQLPSKFWTCTRRSCQTFHIWPSRAFSPKTRKNMKVKGTGSRHSVSFH